MQTKPLGGMQTRPPASCQVSFQRKLSLQVKLTWQDLRRSLGPLQDHRRPLGQIQVWPEEPA